MKCNDFGYALTHTRAVQRAQVAFVLLIAAIFYVLMPTATKAQEAIQTLAIEAAVQNDGTINVTEKYRIRAEGNLYRTGLDLELPLMVRSPYGGAVHRRITNFRVTKDGSPEPAEATDYGGSLNLTTGAGKRLPPGEYNFELHYVAEYQVQFLKGEDELIFPVVPFNSRVPIGDAKISIRLPDQLRASRVFAATGDESSRSGTIIIRQGADNTVVVQTTHALPPENGMLVSVTWPQGHVIRPSFATQLRNSAARNQHILSMLTAIMLAAAWVVASRIYGAKRAVKSDVVPPKFISPGSAHFVSDGRVSMRGLAAQILSLATKGYLTIEETEPGEFQLQRTWRDSDLGILPTEMAVARSFYQNKPTRFVISPVNGLAVRDARKALEQNIPDEIHSAFLRRFPIWVVLFWGLIALCVIVAILRSTAPAWSVVGPLSIVAGMVGSYFGGMRKNTQWGSFRGGFSMTDIVAAWMSDLLGRLGLAFLVFGSLITLYKVGFYELLATLLLGLSATYLYHKMRSPKYLAKRSENEAMALRAFLSGETDKRSGVISQGLYEQLLPYAAAWNLDDVWAQQMKQTNGSLGLADQRPRWFSTPRATMDPQDIALLLTDGLTEALERAAHGRK